MPLLATLLTLISLVQIMAQSTENVGTLPASDSPARVGVIDALAALITNVLGGNQRAGSTTIRPDVGSSPSTVSSTPKLEPPTEASGLSEEETPSPAREGTMCGLGNPDGAAASHSKAKMEAQVREKGDRIVGGEDARKGEFPWQVWLDIKVGSARMLCGGTIINSHYVLTGEMRPKEFPLCLIMFIFLIKPHSRPLHLCMFLWSILPHPHRGFTGIPSSFDQ